jgi:hypothetical protein
VVELHFQKYLTRDKINEIREKYGFRENLPLEQFIMDFEALYHIQKKLPDCVVKGGMAVPFHLKEKSLRRLSVDIDMVTGQTRETVIGVMKEIAEKLDGFITIPENHTPEKKDNKELPLLTYYCNYQSSVEEKPRIKIEIFYDNQLQVKTKRITDNEEIIGFEIDFPLSIFDHGALIGDKLTTLPFNTIGIGGNRGRDIPKQIYDIAHLLKSISDEIPIKEIVETFEIVSREEISYYITNPPTTTEIVEDLLQFSNELLKIEGQINLNDSYEGTYQGFRTEMISGGNYKKQTHIVDILLIKILALFVKKKIKKEIEYDEISNNLRRILDKLFEILQLSRDDRLALTRELAIKHGKKSRNGQIILNSLTEYAFLYDIIAELENND